MSKQYTIKLIGQSMIAENTLECQFTYPGKDYRFRAGQHADYTLVSPRQSDSGGVTRTFSFVSTPDEPHITIATRLSKSAFKQNLASLSPGEVLEISRAMGNLVLHADSAIPAIFVCGGIGITPAISIIKHALFVKQTHRLTLIYANKNKQSTAYFDQLHALAAKYTNFTLQHVWDEAPEGKEALPGPLRQALFGQILAADTLQKGIFYLSGPPAMVADCQDMLTDSGVDLERIRTEEFSGY